MVAAGCGSMTIYNSTHRMPRAAWLGAACLLIASCGFQPQDPPTFAFSVPFTVNGAPADDAFIDTGGGYEVLVSSAIGLPAVGEVNVLAFGGRETVPLAGPFTYSVNGFETIASGALVGLSTCDCNGIGFHFFRRTGLILELDFPARRADFALTTPILHDASIPFAEPPDSLPGFESAFIEVTVSAGGSARSVLGLLDTGANVTVIREGIVGSPLFITPDRQQIAIDHAQLGSVVVTAGLFSTEGLPDLIIGVDVMRRWADRWYMDFTPGGGRVTVVVDADGPLLADGPAGADAQ